MDTQNKALLEANGLSEYEELIESFARPAVALVYGEPDPEAKIDTSKVGGDPALPSVEDWPRKADGQPLDFLVQINFAEVAKVLKLEGFPEDGLCLFFYDVVEQPQICSDLDPSDFRVLYYPAGTALVQVPSLSQDRPFRGDSGVRKGSLNECSLKLAAVTTYPDLWSVAFQELVKKCNWTEEEVTKYEEFHMNTVLQFCDGDSTLHTIAGHAAYLQVDVVFEAETKRVNFDVDTEGTEAEETRVHPGMADWELLLQLDSDQKGGIDWGDCGRLYFLILKGDLAAKRFDRVFFTAECG